MDNRNKYQQIMDHVIVTEEMHEEMLRGIEQKMNTTAASRSNVVPLRRTLALAACLAVILIGAVTYGALRSPVSSSVPEETPGIAETAEIRSASDLTEQSGIIVKDIEPFSEQPEKVNYAFRASTMVEIEYELDKETVRFQKSKADQVTEEEPGVEELPETEELSFKNLLIALRGSSGRYYVADWSDEEFRYSLAVSSGATREEFLDLIQDIMKPGSEDLEAIQSGIEYPRENEYLDHYIYATVSAPHGHSVYGFGSADHSGSSYTVLDGERVLVLAERKGYSCVIVLSQNKGRWINNQYLIPDEEYVEDPF